MKLMQVLLTSISRIFLEVKMRLLNKIRETNWGKIKEQDIPLTKRNLEGAPSNRLFIDLRFCTGMKLILHMINFLIERHRVGRNVLLFRHVMEWNNFDLHKERSLLNQTNFCYYFRLIFRLTAAEQSNEKLVNQKLCKTLL